MLKFKFFVRFGMGERCSSHKQSPEVCNKKEAVLKNYAIFTEKHLYGDPTIVANLKLCYYRCENLPISLSSYENNMLKISH